MVDKYNSVLKTDITSKNICILNPTLKCDQRLLIELITVCGECIYDGRMEVIDNKRKKKHYTIVLKD